MYFYTSHNKKKIRYLRSSTAQFQPTPRGINAKSIIEKKNKYKNTRELSFYLHLISSIHIVSQSHLSSYLWEIIYIITKKLYYYLYLEITHITK